MTRLFFSHFKEIFLTNPKAKSDKRWTNSYKHMTSRSSYKTVSTQKYKELNFLLMEARQTFRPS